MPKNVLYQLHVSNTESYSYAYISLPAPISVVASPEVAGYPTYFLMLFCIEDNTY